MYVNMLKLNCFGITTTAPLSILVKLEREILIMNSDETWMEKRNKKEVLYYHNFSYNEDKISWN